MNEPKLARVAEIQYGLLMQRIQKLIESGKKPGFNYGPPNGYAGISYSVQLRIPKSWSQK